jgi:hypothetical protein
MADAAPTLEQVHAYLLRTGWEQRATSRDGFELWRQPVRDYEDDGMTFPADVQHPDWKLYLDGMLETFAAMAGRCEHEILADILGRPDPATLLAQIEAMQRDLAVLARVGDLYLTALDDDPANEYLTLGGAMLVTEIREAVERQGYDVRWETEADA